MNNMKNSPLPDQRLHQSSNRHRGLGCSIGLLLLLLGLLAGAVVAAPRLLDLLNNPTGTTLVTEPTTPASEQLAARRAAEVAQLNDRGWVDKEGNIARIPIGEAMALVVEHGLPVGDQADASAVVAESEGAVEPPAVDLANVSFDDVLPIFIQHCSECHGDDDPEEGLVLTSYRDVMLGSNYGAVVTPGDPEGSYLVELIATGQMPKRGDDLSQAEIGIIVAWIAAGAQDSLAEATAPSPDRTPPTTTVTTPVTTPVTTTVATAETAPATPSIVATETATTAAPITATGGVTVSAPVTTSVMTTSTAPVASTTTATETASIRTTEPTTATVDLSNVSFQNDVLPIFQDYCAKCHGDDDPEEGLVLTNYRDVMLGSIYGAVINPGDPDGSYLVELVATGQMPKRGDDLTQPQIDVIVAWIRAGAEDN